MIPKIKPEINVAEADIGFVNASRLAEKKNLIDITLRLLDVSVSSWRI